MFRGETDNYKSFQDSGKILTGFKSNRVLSNVLPIFDITEQQILEDKNNVKKVSLCVLITLRL